MKLFRQTAALLLTGLLSLSAQAESPSATPNLDRINERGTLRVGMSTFVPWAMRDKQGELIGFEIDVARRLAADSGWQVEFVPTAWDGIIPALQANKFDVIIGGMSITPGRSKSVLFTTPYARSGIQVTASKALAGELSAHSDFNSRKVTLAARRGARSAQTAREQFPKAKLLQFDDDAQAIQEVLNGNAHAMLAATPLPEHQTVRNSERLFMPFSEALSKGKEGFGVRLGEEDKRAYFDQWIAARTADGWLAERYAYWFTTLDWQNQLAQQ